MKFIKKNSLILFIFIFCFFLVFGAVAVADNLNDAFKINDKTIDDPLDSAAYRAGYDVKTRTDHLNPTIQTIINIGLSLLGVTFMLLIIYGGFLWMTDQGSEEQVERAKKMIISALIGLLIVVSAYAVSYLIITVFSEKALKNAEVVE